MPKNVIRDINRRVELDRQTWASESTVVLRYETTGSGSFLTPELEFGIRFSGAPYVSFGAEMSVVDSLVDGDYPHVTVGVAEWVTKSYGEDSAGPAYDVTFAGISHGVQVREIRR